MVSFECVTQEEGAADSEGSRLLTKTIQSQAIAVFILVR